MKISINLSFTVYKISGHRQTKNHTKEPLISMSFHLRVCWALWWMEITKEPEIRTSIWLHGLFIKKVSNKTGQKRYFSSESFLTDQQWFFTFRKPGFSEPQIPHLQHHLARWCIVPLLKLTVHHFTELKVRLYPSRKRNT